MGIGVKDQSTHVQALRVSSNHLLDLAAILECHERRHLDPSKSYWRQVSDKAITHSADSDLLGDGRGFIAVDLVEVGIWELFREFLEDGRDNSAWSTPGCPEVKDSDTVLCDLRALCDQIWCDQIERSTHDVPELVERSNSLDDHVAL